MDNCLLQLFGYRLYTFFLGLVYLMFKWHVLQRCSIHFLMQKGCQLVNSFIAIGSGGVSGRGYGNSIQQEGFLPEPHTDFIMSIVSEELGIIGVLIILTGLLTIVLRSFKIAQECKSQFGSLISIGIGSMIGLQSIVNLGGVTGMFSLTGTPLPFISFGGSSLMANLIAMGLLINISIFNKKKIIYLLMEEKC